MRERARRSVCCRPPVPLIFACCGKSESSVATIMEKRMDSKLTHIGEIAETRGQLASYSWIVVQPKPTRQYHDCSVRRRTYFCSISVQLTASDLTTCQDLRECRR